MEIILVALQELELERHGEYKTIKNLQFKELNCITTLQQVLQKVKSLVTRFNYIQIQQQIQ